MGKIHVNNKMVLLSTLALGMIWFNSTGVKADSVETSEGADDQIQQPTQNNATKSTPSVQANQNEETVTGDVEKTAPNNTDDTSGNLENTGNKETASNTGNTSTTTDPSNQVSYTINYVDSNGNVLQSNSGTAAGGSSVTVPTAVIAGYKQNVSSQYQLKTIATDADKNQTISVSMDKLDPAQLEMKTLESDSDIDKRMFWTNIDVNDSNYQNEVKDWLSILQKGRKIDFAASYYEDVPFNRLSYLEGMENASPTDLVLKILENEGCTDLFNENLSGKEIFFLLQYLPIDEPYVVDYVAVGGPQDGKVIYVDNGENDPGGVLPTTPLHRNIPVAHAVAGYPSVNDAKDMIDENDISFDEAKGILTFKVYAIPDFNLTINEYDKTKKLVKTVKWDIPVNSKFATQPDSTSDPLFPNGTEAKDTISSVLTDSFYKDLIMDKNLIVDDSTVDEKDASGDSDDIPIPVSYVMPLYARFGLDTSNTNMGYLTKYIMNCLMPNGTFGDGRSGQELTINAYLDYVSENNNSNPTVPVNPGNVVNKTDNIATTTKEVSLYDNKGNLITNRSLGINTTWQSNQELTYNGVKYYQVAPGEYAKASDVYLYKDTDTNLVRIFNDGDGSLIDYLGNHARTLDSETDWKTDRIALINGEEYYRVSTNEFIKVDKVQPYIDDFENLNTTDPAELYDEHGNDLAIKLPKNRSYKTDRIVRINGKKYYRVSTNEFVKVSDIKKMAK